MKRALITLAALFVIALLVGGFFAFRVARTLLSAAKMPPRPDALKIAKVVSGSGLFSRSDFYREPDLGVITDVQPRQDGGLVIIGQDGAAFLNSDGSFNRNIQFEKCNSDVVLAEVGPGGFLCRGAWSKGAMFFDRQGNTLWSYGGQLPGVDDAVAGKLGTAGPEGIVVGLNGDGGIRLLNLDGKEIWKQDDGNVWHVEIVTIDDKPGDFIVHSNARGQLTVRDANGSMLARYTPELYLATFSLSAWKDDPRVSKLVAADQNFIYVLNTEGRVLARLPAPGNAGIADPKGTPVKFSDNHSYYVGLLRHSLWTRSLLYIYDDKDELVYNEILDQDCDSLHAIPTSGHNEDLLLGCNGIVWKYSLRR